MTPGSDGLPFHGHSAGTFDGAAYYAYSNGRMRCGMVVCQFYLTDVGDDDGGERRSTFRLLPLVSLRALNSRGFAGRAGARPMRGARFA